MGLVVANRAFRLRFLPLRCLHVHATGDRLHDDITIEHNGLLVTRDGAEHIQQAMLSFICSPQLGWDQVHLPGLSSVPPLADFVALNVALRHESETGYSVDLAGIRGRGTDYLGQLSRNTRSQIRRSIKTYAALGPVEVTAARDAQEALLFLGRLKAFHQRTWTARGAAGAFANPLFEAFHVQLIDRGFPCGQVQLLRIHAGEHDIGYLYNFVYKSRVSCYQSGFNYELVEKNSRPGLVSHALAIQHCADLGNDVYDFLAGDARYKGQLASDTYQMMSLSFLRNTHSLRVQDKWREFKKKLRFGTKTPLGEPEAAEDS